MLAIDFARLTFPIYGKYSIQVGSDVTSIGGQLRWVARGRTKVAFIVVDKDHFVLRGGAAGSTVDLTRPASSYGSEYVDLMSSLGLATGLARSDSDAGYLIALNAEVWASAVPGDDGEPHLFSRWNIDLAATIRVVPSLQRRYLADVASPLTAFPFAASGFFPIGLSPLADVLQFLETVLHEMLHCAFFIFFPGLNHEDETCEMDIDPRLIARPSRPEHSVSGHALVTLIAAEVVETAVFGEPYGYLALRRCCAVVNRGEQTSFPVIEACGPATGPRAQAG